MKRSCRAALFAFLVLATAAYAQGSSKTHFLVARPGMPDPNFRETVVLVTHEEGAEATGVIINRPTNRSLAEMLPSERFKPFKEPIFFGGPVAGHGGSSWDMPVKASGSPVPAENVGCLRALKPLIGLG